MTWPATPNSGLSLSVRPMIQPDLVLSQGLFSIQEFGTRDETTKYITSTTVPINIFKTRQGRCGQNHPVRKLAFTLRYLTYIFYPLQLPAERWCPSLAYLCPSASILKAPICNMVPRSLCGEGPRISEGYGFEGMQASSWEPLTIPPTTSTCHRHTSPLADQCLHSNALSLWDLKDHGDTQVIYIYLQGLL